VLLLASCAAGPDNLAQINAGHIAKFWQGLAAFSGAARSGAAAGSPSPLAPTLGRRLGDRHIGRAPDAGEHLLALARWIYAHANEGPQRFRPLPPTGTMTPWKPGRGKPG